MPIAEPAAPAPAPASASDLRTAAPAIGVILVNWNGWRDTVAAHHSLQQSAYADWVLIVVDNASADDSAQRLAEALPQAVLIRSPVNAGFAGGCNLGLRRARELGLRYAFLLNNDAAVEPATLGALLAASAALDDSAVLGCVVRYASGGALQFFGSRRGALHGGPAWLRGGDPADTALLGQPLIETDFVFGAALFTPLALLHDVGDFDERFFLNYEETDWCYRARARGHGVYVVTAAQVRHAGSASLGAVEGPMQSYFLHRNRLLFSEKHASRRQRWRVAQELWLSFRADLRKSHRAARARGLRYDPSKKAMLLAVRDYLLRRFGDCPAEVRRLAREARARPPLAEAAAEPQAPR